MASGTGRKVSIDLIQRLIAKRIKDSGKGMDKLLTKVRVTHADSGCLTAVLKLDKEHSNLAGTMHGGMACYLVDAVSSLALITCPNVKSFGVSVNINVVFIKGAAVGDEVEIKARADKLTNKLAFLSVDIVNKRTKELCVTASHTMYTASNKPGTQIAQLEMCEKYKVIAKHDIS